MSDSEEPGMLIKPQVQPASSLHGHHEPNEAEEKKKRIDDALQRYEAHTSPAHETEPTSAKEEEKPRVDAVAPTPHLHKKLADPFIAAHLREAVAVLQPQKKAVNQGHSEVEEVFAPTQVDPEAPIALAVATVKERQAALEAKEQAEAARPEYRYKQSQPIRIGVFVTRKSIVLATLWLLAIPLAVIMYNVTASLQSAAATFASVAEYLLGAYGAFGWIPLVVFYIREHKD